jgi:uncharacterized damage-inducible protein DinB
MDKKTVVFLAQYNQAANEKMDAVIKTLTPGEWDRDLGGFFKSVHALCSHLYVCDHILLKKRYFAAREFKLAKDSFFAPDYTSYRTSTTELLFSTMEEYLSARPELDKKILEFSEELTEEDFSLITRFRDSYGNLKEKELGGTILHGFNHQTHHRGMISVYLEILGKDNDFSSLLALVEKQG